MRDEVGILLSALSSFRDNLVESGFDWRRRCRFKGEGSVMISDFTSRHLIRSWPRISFVRHTPSPPRSALSVPSPLLPSIYIYPFYLSLIICFIFPITSLSPPHFLSHSFTSTSLYILHALPLASIICSVASLLRSKPIFRTCQGLIHSH